MGFLNDFFKNIWVTRIISSLIVIIISFCIYQFVSHAVKKHHSKITLNKKTKTYLRLINSIIRYIFILITCLVLLEVNGVHISSLLAGVGIFSIIIGFAIQDALKDIIKGFDILSESYYQVGDVIKYDNNTGRVLAVGLKTTKIEDVNTFNIVSISNRNIEKVEVVSRLININIPFSYEIKKKKAEEVINSIVEKISKQDKIEKCEYRGINDFNDSDIAYQIKVFCNPVEKMQIRRDCLCTILEVLEQNNISIPYQQIDIHQK